MAVKINGGAKAPTETPQTSKKTGGGMGSFLKQGAAAKQAVLEDDAKKEAQKAEAGKLWRFRIQEGDDDDHRVTFLDGTLDDEGTLEAPMWHEHTLQLGGKWKNVPCTSHEEPCPICANGDNPSLVAGFTVIDHTPYTIQSGPNAGKVVKFSRKLFVAKRTTYAQLQKLATKQGGLVGTTWDISRNGDKSPAVGNMFQLEAKQTLAEVKKELAAIKAEYGELVEPADFAQEITYYTRAELIQQGVKAASSAGAGTSKFAKKGNADASADDELGS